MGQREFTVTVYYDYICPWCYLGQIVAKRLRSEHGARIDWLPLLLHPEISPEGRILTPEEKDGKAEMYERVTRMAKANKLDIVFPGRMVYTRRAIEATEYARGQGRRKLLSFHEAVFDRLYGKGQDVGDWGVLGSAAAEAGLDAEEMRRTTESGRYGAVVEAQFLEAERRGIDSLPTYILDGRYAVIGPQPYEVFQLVLDKMAEP
jgi:predicted DsbA family dithiol-disulfide isomerase